MQFVMTRVSSRTRDMPCPAVVGGSACWLALIVCCLVGKLHALSGEQMSEFYKLLDVDNKGKLARDKATKTAEQIQLEKELQVAQRVVRMLDKSENGKVDMPEYAHGMYGEEGLEALPEDQRTEELDKFIVADKDKDEELDAKELMAFLKSDVEDEAKYFMAEMDKDEDGKISSEEWFNGDSLTPELTEKLNVELPELNVDSEAVEDLKDKASQEFKRVDTDRNGQLSLDELRVWLGGASKTKTGKMMTKIFKLADADKDGHLTEAELVKIAKRLHEGSEVSDFILAIITKEEEYGNDEQISSILSAEPDPSAGPDHSGEL
eukprot:gnl/TRDRNA2_/TRDRNA2_188592_c0_seq1.p1 gnl/TRDRNA2_/TRDRNA2_188592_c0~~gnl/TRDRNA2_/TRDRNA2_188592_c0_seq1.p1  ORF type:complete len:321 (+),score=92.43 gnl/TRDRNA2_/TRDRNA2_188592_c0_seq1:1-963(+)